MRPVPRRLIGGVVNIVVTATTRVIGLGPPAGQRRLAWLGVGLGTRLGLGLGVGLGLELGLALPSFEVRSCDAGILLSS